MTTVGKILIVLHLFMSVLFMAFAGAVYTAQNNWKKAQEKTAKELAEAKRQATDREAETSKQLADAAHKSATLENEIVKFKGNVTALDIQVKTLTADNNQLRKEVDQQRDQSALTTAEAAERKKEADRQREKNTEVYMSRDEFIRKLHETEDKRFALETQLKMTTEKFDQLLNDKRIMTAFLSSKNLPVDPKLMVALTTPPPPLDGRVTRVEKPDREYKRELVQISIGRDSGLEVGHRLTVFRGEKYLGIIRLVRVDADASVGYVEERTKNAIFRIDDEVTTEF